MQGDKETLSGFYNSPQVVINKVLSIDNQVSRPHVLLWHNVNEDKPFLRAKNVCCDPNIRRNFCFAYLIRAKSDSAIYLIWRRNTTIQPAQRKKILRAFALLTQEAKKAKKPQQIWWHSPNLESENIFRGS